MRTDPIILMCFHRSGSTYLTRLLNTNKNVMVWGEHGGFITAVRNSARVAGSRLFNEALRKDIDTAKADCTTKFIPFMNGFTLQEYERSIAQLLDTTFSAGLPPGTRWGFKEIRYLSVDMVDFFFTLFPETKMLFCLRDPIELCTASLRASWVVERLRSGHNGYNSSLLPEVVYNVMLRINVHQRLAVYAARRYGSDRVSSVRYEDLASDTFIESCRINRFLELDVPDENSLQQTSNHRAGVGQYKTAGDPPEIFPDNLRRVARTMYEHVLANRIPDGIQFSHKWNFCMGIMPNDLHSFNTDIPNLE